MDARTSIKGKVPSRLTAGSSNAALRLPVIAPEWGIPFSVAKIQKKPPSVADLKRHGRYVAKDMVEIANMPLLTGLKLAEHFKSAKRNPHQGVVRSAGTPIAVAIVDPIALLPDGEIDAGVGFLNVKLTEAELAERKTKWKPRATNHTSGALWKYAQQAGTAVDGAKTHPGGAHEKQCYADI